MINHTSIKAVAAARQGSVVQPIFADYGFANMPATIQALLTGGTPAIPFGPRHDLVQHYDAVVVLLVDAFGWRFFEQYADRSLFLQHVMREGLINKLTAQFPSTTAVHVTTIHTGLPLAQHGVCEWFYYEPQLDAMISPLLFSFAGDKHRDTLAAHGVEPGMLYPPHTFYQRLGDHGVRSVVMQSAVYATSPYSQWVTRGAQVVPYHTLPQAIATLAELRERQQQPTYYYLYWEGIDTICHANGPDSPQAQAEIELFLAAMDVLLLPRLAQRKKPTLLLLTADHGHTAVDPATTVYINQTLPEIVACIKTNTHGQPLAPGGSCRDLFLQIKPERLEEAHRMLTRHLEGRATVRRVADMLAEGYFGPPPITPLLRARLGDLVVLPDAGESVWWYERGRFEQHYHGFHGGLSPEEMETLLLALPCGG